MKIVVGLGNPEGKYKNTVHNVGFSALDDFAKSEGLKFCKNKCKALLAIGEGFILAKPQTYMNRSGESVAELKKYFKVGNKDILIVLDDIDIPKGKIRFRSMGSAGTHNGLRDIVDKVGETPRLRIGMDKDPNMNLIDYVLSEIDETGKEILKDSFAEVNKLIKKFILDELNEDVTINVRNK